MSKTNNNKMLTLRVPNSLKTKLQAVASYNEVSVSKLIRHSLNNLINERQTIKDASLFKLDGF